MKYAFHIKINVCLTILMNKYKQNVNINIQRIERRLKRNRRKDFLTYDEYLQHRCKIKQRYKDAHLTKYAQKSPQPTNHQNRTNC